MNHVRRETRITTIPERCFDLSRSIDFHKFTMAKFRESPVGGRVKGLIEAGEFVEWEATHFFIRQRLSSRIIAMKRPYYFVDVMVRGAFKSFIHRHEIRTCRPGEVILIDDFRYEVPLGIVGRFANFLFLHDYMEKMIGMRCSQLKAVLESDRWKEFI